MSAENKTLSRRFYEEVFNKGNLDAIDELCTPDFVVHTPFPGMDPSREGMKQMFGMFQQAFPDMRLTVDEMVAEGDTVVARLTMTGTHTGDMMGIPPTGRQFKTRGMDLVHIVNGKATEVWHFEEEMAFWQQLGITPPME